MANFLLPFTNMHELNLDWMLHEVKKLACQMDNFIEIYLYAIIGHIYGIGQRLAPQIARRLGVTRATSGARHVGTRINQAPQQNYQNKCRNAAII